jgi:hypothetical protein
MSDRNLDQRIYIEFSVKIGKCASKTLVLLTFAYDEYAIKKLSMLNWNRRF